MKKNLDLGKIFVTLKIFLKSRVFCNHSNILLAKVRWVAGGITMCVGFGNVWRFPGIAYDNGGGAFVWVYLTILFFIARPLLFLEMSLGQFSGQSNVGFWANICPIFKGTFFGLNACFAVWYICLHVIFVLILFVLVLFVLVPFVLVPFVPVLAIFLRSCSAFTKFYRTFMTVRIVPANKEVHAWQYFAPLASFFVYFCSRLFKEW